MGMEGRRRLVQVIPDPGRELWDKWEIRGLVLISIALQFILTLLGNRRKYGTNKVIDSILWCAYLLANTVASIALGAISSKLGDYYDKHGEPMEDPQLMAFWAPFFLMHIGGPITITAYSLEDNELWLRHLVGLMFQTLLTLYIILLSWDNFSWLSYLSIPMLIIGCVKYGERTWSLFSASTNNYFANRWLASYISKSVELCNDNSSIDNFGDIPLSLHAKGVVINYFSDTLMEAEEIEGARQLLYSKRKEIFKILDALHGMVFDVFYTKAAAVFCIWGCISWLVTLVALMVVLTLHFTFDTKSNGHLTVDRIITLILLFEAIISHFVSTLLFIISSEWMFEYIIVPNELISQRIKRWFESQILEKRKRWNLMAQCNFLSLLCSKKDMFYISGNSLPIRNVEKIQIISRYEVSSNLKEMLIDNFIKKLDESASTRSQHGLRYRELVKDQRLRRRRQIIENLEFHQSILLWHIVTDVCYYSNDSASCHENEVRSKESKRLSDYMFYLLVKQRHMLPIGAGLLSLRDTLAEALFFCERLKKLTLPSDVSEACKTILQHIRDDTGYVADHPKGRSVFRYAFITAIDLLALGDKKQMWDFLMELWIEILYYSAAHSRVDRHAQQLANGGEFFSHIWLLQSAGCLMGQFQIIQPYIEADDNIV